MDLIDRQFNQAIGFQKSGTEGVSGKDGSSDYASFGVRRVRAEISNGSSIFVKKDHATDEGEWQKAFAYTDVFGTERQFISYLFFPLPIPDDKKLSARAFREFTSKRCQGFINQTEANVPYSVKISPGPSIPDDIDVVYEDPSIMIINKKSGVLMHPLRCQQDDSEATLMHSVIKDTPEQVRLPAGGLVNRLDYGTSGVFLCAKNFSTYAHMVLNRKEVIKEKKYHCILEGAMQADKTTITVKVPARLNRKILQNATTHVEVLETFKSHTLMECKIETGRNHQIRRHMKSIGHPIVGDKSYNGKYRRIHRDKQSPISQESDLETVLKNYDHQALHALSITVIHPVTQETIIGQATLPEDFQLLLNLLKKDKES